jgi:hypothetical protein
MNVYSYVNTCIDGMEIGELRTIPIPDKLKAFRKFLSEISGREHTKYTTKIKNGMLHIMRVNYYSVNQVLNHED